jgi:hypothetical protein
MNLIGYQSLIFNKTNAIGRLINFSPLMEPEVSLPCTQEAATSTYPEPDEVNPDPHAPFL